MMHVVAAAFWNERNERNEDEEKGEKTQRSTTREGECQRRCVTVYLLMVPEVISDG